MQSHHGSKLKKLIEKSGMTFVRVSEKSEVPLSSMYDMFKKEELTRKKIETILNALEISPDDFFIGNRGKEGEDLKVCMDKVQMLESQVEILRQTIEDKNQIIELLKKKK